MKSKRLLLLLLIALIAPWAAKAQDLADYTFSTGQDEAQWITLSDGLSSIVSSGDDSYSALTDIGFSFPFGDGTYNKFWANANGIFSFSSSPNGNYSNQFTSSNLSANQPKICGITRDMGVPSSGGYVKYELTGTAPNRVLVCEFNLQSTSGSSGTPTVNFQVQLHENGSKVVLVYGAAASPSSFQIGLSQSTTDLWTINPGTHEATHATGAVSSTYSTWPGANRYYEFSRPVVACPKPTGLVASNITHNEAKLSWTENGTATSWQVCLNNDETNLITANSNPYTLTGLTPITAYTAKVRAIGNDEYSAWSNEVSFSTTAVAEAVGDSWNDDFEGTACGWELVNGTQTNVWAWGTAVNNGGSHSLYVSNDNGTTNAYSHTTSTVFATKFLNFTEGKFEFSYNWKANGESTYDYLRVALAPADATITAGNYNFTSSTLPTGWIALDGGSKLNLVTAWQSQSVAVNVPAGKYYLVMAWRNDGSGGTTPPAAVDNVSITRVACGYDVTDLAAGNITTTSADITWTAGEATGWQVAYKTNAASEWTENQPVSMNSATLSGLAASTNYQVKVRAYCGGQDYGSWCDPINFATECDVFIDLDENFDSYTGTTSGSTNNLPLCWSYINTSTYSTYKGYPVVYNYPSGSNSGNNHLRFYSYYSSSYSSYDPQSQYAILPAIEDVNTMRIKLYARANSTSSSYNSTFKVGVMTDPTDASTFSEVATYTPASTTYEQYVLPLDSYTGTGTYIAIMIEAAEAFGENTYGYRSVFIDDIIVEPIPSCLEPTDLAASDITSSSATVTWVSDANHFKLEVKKQADETWQILTIGNTNTHTLSNLEANTVYDIRVKAVCNTDPWEESAYTTTNFTTDCGAETIPYTYGFETEAPFDCWTPITGVTRENSTYNAHNSTYYLKFSGTTSNMVALPAMNVDLSTLSLEFWTRPESNTNSSCGTFSVGYMTDITDASTFVEVANYAYNDWTSATYEKKTVDFTNAPANANIAFRHNAGATNWYWFVDDVTVKVPVYITAHQIVNNVSDPATEMTWSQFVQYWNNGDHFTSTTFTLMENITINEMVGTTENPFTGTFDGNGHTITFNYTATENYCAPFRYVRNATIQDLAVGGTINTANQFAGGFVGDCFGNNTLTNCLSNVTINSTKSGDGTHGGFIGRNSGGGTVNLTGCAFTGSLLGTETTSCAGLVGWTENGQYGSPSHTIFTNCVFAPAEVTIGTTSSYTFSRIYSTSGTPVTFNNCYYTETFGTAQGKQAYTITAESPVTVAMSGEYTEYDMSGITAYASNYGLLYNNGIIAGDGETVSLTLSGAAGYETNHGTLVANGDVFTLTMEAYDTEISAVDCPVPYNVAVPAATLAARSVQVTWQGGSDSYTVEYREVITPAANENTTYDFEDGTMQGWTSFDEDGDGNGWIIGSSSGTAHGGSSYVYARYNSNAVPNDWLISPQIPLGGTFSFYAKKSSGTEQFQVYLSTTGSDISNFTAISEVIDAGASYNLYEYDLSSYSGNGYVAIKHTGAVNQYWFYVDDITYTVSIEGEYGEWQTVNNATSPQTINNLTPETTYEVRVKGICGGVETDYSDVVEFTTPASCVAPTGLAVSGITATGASFSWDAEEGATWQYCTFTLPHADPTDADFSSSTIYNTASWPNAFIPSTQQIFWLRKDCGNGEYSQPVSVEFTMLDACVNLTCTAVTTTTATLSWTDNAYGVNSWQVMLNNDAEHLITVTMNPCTLTDLTAATAYTAKVRAAHGNCVGGYTDWSNEVSFTTECAAVTVTAGNSFFEDFEEYTGTTYNGTSNVNIPTCWENYSDNTSGYVYAKPHILSAGAQYNFATSGQVLYFYGSGNGYAMLPEFTNPLNELAISFKYATESSTNGTLTLGYITAEDENFNTFTAIEGGTFNASSASDDTFVDVGPIVLSSLPATASRLVFRWYYSGQWGANVDDVEVSLVQTITKEIAGYGTSAKGGYYLIASPVVENVTPAANNGFIAETAANYDLYYFNQAAPVDAETGIGLEWINFKDAEDGNFAIENGKGYLYASKEGTTLSFTGTPYSGNGQVPLVTTAGAEWAGWNLVGNPFGEDATIDRDCYVMNTEGRAEIIATDNRLIPAMEGAFVIANSAEDVVSFVAGVAEAGGNDSKLVLNLTKNNSVLDRAMVRFGEGRQLPKFQLRKSSTKVYIPQEGKDYAVVRSEAMGTMPVNFKAEENGTYTLSFNAEEVSFAYLHLIDNMTGEDVDLLAGASTGSATYTFDARTTDYESRFKLVFATGNNANEDAFAFYSNGSFIINNEGEATLQVIDVNGRILKNERINGSANVNVKAAAGVYMLRLVNGNDVKVQKVVVR